MSNFSKKLRDLRKKKGLTQQELSDRLGISRSAVSMYEREDREPDFETLEAIADFFNVDMNYLLGDSSETTVIVRHDDRESMKEFFERVLPEDSRSKIFNICYELNEDGQKRLLEYAKDLSEMMKYKK